MNIVRAVQDNNVRILDLYVEVPGSYSEKQLQQGLLQAIRSNHPECAQILIKAGADVNWQDNADNSLLKMAAEYGYEGMVQTLIGAAECQVNLRCGSRGTALHHAARWGKAGCVRLLLEAGANPNLRDGAGNTPLLLAAKNGQHMVIRTLVAFSCNLNATDGKGKTALHYVSNSALGGPAVLLEAGADPNIQDEDGNTPLHMAAVEGLDGHVQKLLQFDADPDFPNNINGWTPLHILAMKNHWDSIDALSTTGCHFDVTDSKGNVALWYAVNHNRPEAVKALLRANCSANQPKDADGNPVGGNPLQTALQKKLYGIAKLIVLAGCDMAPVYEWMGAIQEAEMQRPDRGTIFWPTEEEDSDSETDSEEEDAIGWLEDWVHTPHSLCQLCRITIRRYLGYSIHARHHALPIPLAIKDYITLREVDDHHIVGFVM